MYLLPLKNTLHTCQAPLDWSLWWSDVVIWVNPTKFCCSRILSFAIQLMITKERLDKCFIIASHFAKSIHQTRLKFKIHRNLSGVVRPHLQLDLLSIPCHCMHVILKCNAHQTIISKHSTIGPQLVRCLHNLTKVSQSILRGGHKTPRPRQHILSQAALNALSKSRHSEAINQINIFNSVLGIEKCCSMNCGIWECLINHVLDIILFRQETA